MLTHLWKGIHVIGSDDRNHGDVSLNLSYEVHATYHAVVRRSTINVRSSTIVMLWQPVEADADTDSCFNELRHTVSREQCAVRLQGILDCIVATLSQFKNSTNQREVGHGFTTVKQNVPVDRINLSHTFHGPNCYLHGHILTVFLVANYTISAGKIASARHVQKNRGDSGIRSAHLVSC